MTAEGIYKGCRYEIIDGWQGYVPEITDTRGQRLYPRKVYRGAYTFTLDYGQSKIYASIDTAMRHVRGMIEQERKETRR